MEKKLISKISEAVYKKFPELKGEKPKVKPEPQAKSIRSENKFILTYKGYVIDPSGRKFPRNVRVVADQKGKIIRMSTSR
jgi:hypothetical protein